MKHARLPIEGGCSEWCVFTCAVTLRTRAVSVWQQADKGAGSIGGWGHAESLPQVLPPVHRLDTHALCSARKTAARLHGVPCGILTVSLACPALHSSRVSLSPCCCMRRERRSARRPCCLPMLLFERRGPKNDPSMRTKIRPPNCEGRQSAFTFLGPIFRP